MERACIRCGLAIPGKAKKLKYCSRACYGQSHRGEAHARYKGGFVNAAGYHMISIVGKLKLYHRHLIEQHLGRPLASDEIVHHKDGNKLNNCIDNLEVMKQSRHAATHHPLFRSDTEKQCRDCLQVKSRSDFNRSCGQPTHDPHKARCKGCQCVYEAELRAKRRQDPSLL